MYHEEHVILSIIKEHPGISRGEVAKSQKIFSREKTYRTLDFLKKQKKTREEQIKTGSFYTRKIFLTSAGEAALNKANAETGKIDLEKPTSHKKELPEDEILNLMNFLDTVHERVVGIEKDFVYPANNIQSLKQSLLKIYHELTSMRETLIIGDTIVDICNESLET